MPCAAAWQAVLAGRRHSLLYETLVITERKHFEIITICQQRRSYAIDAKAVAKEP